MIDCDRVWRRLGNDGMHLLRVGRFHRHLANIQFMHEEREDFILRFSEGTNIRTTSVTRNSPDGELLQRFMNVHQWVDSAST